MKTDIYTFTGTGTALSISDQVGDSIGDTTVRLIPKLMENAVAEELKADAPRVGFIFPNYFGGIPNIVLDFIRKLNMDEVKYVFAIVPAGGGSGFSLRYLKKELEQKGKKLNYGRYVMSIGNYIAASYYEAILKSGERREKVLGLLRENILLYAEDIKKEKDFVEWSNPFVYMVNRFLSSFSTKEILKDTSNGDRKYSVNSKCTGCSTCLNVCQANNIVMTGGNPSFRHQCYRCMACMQYCPQNAIVFEGKELSKKKYMHPDFPAKEMIRRIQET